MNGIILFTGVHGVGKGYFLNKVLENDERFICYGASNLIGRYKDATDAGYKKVKNVDDNQDVLLEALNIEKQKINKNILLDGHLCIINSINKIQKIPENFILKAKICGIILLQDTVSSILNRQTVRDNKSLTMDTINSIQKEEIKYAKQLNEKYDIRVKRITHECNKDQFMQILNNMWGDYFE